MSRVAPAEPPAGGRSPPRWSSGGPAALPVSMAGLVERSACVSVGPPLSASGPSCGSVFDQVAVALPEAAVRRIDVVAPRGELARSSCSTCPSRRRRRRSCCARPMVDPGLLADQPESVRRRRSCCSRSRSSPPACMSAAPVGARRVAADRGALDRVVDHRGRLLGRRERRRTRHRLVDDHVRRGGGDRGVDAAAAHALAGGGVVAHRAGDQAEAGQALELRPLPRRSSRRSPCRATSPCCTARRRRRPRCWRGRSSPRP